METVTAQQIIKFDPCEGYTPQRIQQLFDAAGLTEASAVDILQRGPELGIPTEDLLWLVLRPELIEPGIAVGFALHCAEHVETHCEIAQKCNAIARRFLTGQATREELEVAIRAAAALDVEAAGNTFWATRAAYWAAQAVTNAAVMAATGAAAWAVWIAEAARDAAGAARAAVLAAEAAEMEWQRQELLAFLMGSERET